MGVVEGESLVARRPPGPPEVPHCDTAAITQDRRTERTHITRCWDEN